MRKGGNPDIAEAGKNTRFGSARGYDPVKAAEKANQKIAEEKDIAKLVLQGLDASQFASVILQRARSGNIKFVELTLKLIGQMPPDKVEATVTAENPLTALSPEELKEIYYGGGKE